MFKPPVRVSTAFSMIESSCATKASFNLSARVISRVADVSSREPSDCVAIVEIKPYPEPLSSTT
jgi:hypothetical protein